MTSALRPQRTVVRPVGVNGFGYWSGQNVRVEFHPAPANHGLVFVRTDCVPNVRIPARVENRNEVPRRTNLGCRGASVEMVEHVMAALAGMRIDNCEIRVNAAEMPGGDGSCLPFVTVLRQAGVVEQSEPRPVLTVRKPVRVSDRDTWVEALPRSASGLLVEYTLDFGSDHVIPAGHFKIEVTPDLFEQQLAPARTFILQSEANWLQAQGLGQRVTPQDLLVFDTQGVVGNHLRFDDECVRHKTLDLIGDLALSGCDLSGHVRASRSGHKLNSQLVAALLESHSIHETLKHSA